MNTIKFRGKILNGERKGEWVYGSYLEFTVQGVKNARIIPMFDCKEEVLDDTMDITIDCIAVDPETIGQYIGVNDKKENEVYEDDIVLEKNRCGGEIIARIIYYKNGFYLDDGIYSNWDAEDITVLGNFTDNPDLLTQ